MARNPGGQALFMRPDVNRSSIFHYLMVAYLFIFCSRIQEFVPQVRVSALLGYGLLAVVALTLQGGAILKMPGGKLLIAFTAWVMACVPFSVWIGGSIDYLRSAVQSLLVVVLIAALVHTVRESLRSMSAVALAMAVAALMSFVTAGSVANRLVVGEGTFGDPNYYALYLLIGLPFLGLAATHGMMAKRILSLILILPVLRAAAATGSRGGLLAFAAGMLALFWFVPLRQKIVLLLLGVVLMVGAQATLPEEIMSRFTTLVGASSPEDDEIAGQSANARRHLLIRSLEMTAKNPIIGAGPGMFMVAENEAAREEGFRKGSWHVTHNTYTQLSSEIGIPGLLLFVAILWVSWRGLGRIRHGGLTADTRRAALVLQVAFVIMTVAALFLSLGYGGLFYILIGVSGAFQMAVARETGTAMPPTAPAPAPYRTVRRAGSLAPRPS